MIQCEEFTSIILLVLLLHLGAHLHLQTMWPVYWQYTGMHVMTVFGDAFSYDMFGHDII